MLLVTGFATVSQIANHYQLYHAASLSFVTREIRIVTSHDYVININDPWKY